MKVTIKELNAKLVKLLSKNFGKKNATRIAEVLIWSEMNGIKTQGVIKLTGTEPLHKVKPKHKVLVVRNTKLSSLIDAGANPAPLVSQIATDMVIKKAKKYGFAIVGINNMHSSNGTQSFYGNRIAKENLIGIVVTRSPGGVAPFDSIDPIFGTNPICFAFPTTKDPLLFDMATSALTWYGLVEAKITQSKIPSGVAIDKNGKITTDPEKAMHGALLPFDKSYKGSGLGMVVEILGGVLVSGGYVDMRLESGWGSVFMAIDPELLVDLKEFKRNCTDLMNKIKSSRKQKGSKSIRLPNDRSYEAYKEAEKSGSVEVHDAILKEIGLL